MQWDGAQYKTVNQDGTLAGTQQAYTTTQAGYSTASHASNDNTGVGIEQKKTLEQQAETVNVFGQKPKNARKIAKDMERWAKKFNNLNETRKAAVKQAQDELRVLEQKEEELRKRINMEKSITGSLAQIVSAKTNDGVRSLFVPEYEDEGNVLKLGSALAPSTSQKPRGTSLVADFPLDDEDDVIVDESQFVDLVKMACLLCQRQLMSKENLTKHLQMSTLHKQNLENYKQSKMKK